MRKTILLSCCSLLAIAPAFAQNAASSKQHSGGVEEIVVTAQKREQKLSDVGITVVAKTGSQLKAAGVSDVFDLPKVTPGLTTAVTFGGIPIYSLRGVNFNASQIAVPPAVSTYIDEAPLPYSPMTAGMLFDVERVEVLKGPQGTLFGQNATGGSINLIAAKPTSVLSGGFGMEMNNFGQLQFDGFISGPLSDKLRVRLAGTTTQGGAWQKGYYLNSRKNGSANRGSVRLLTDWTPNDWAKISLNLTGTYDNGEVQEPQLHKVIVGNPAAAAPGLLTYRLPTTARDTDIDPGLKTNANNHTFQAVLRGDFDLNDALKLTSITGYIDNKVYMPRDYDGTAIDLIEGATVGHVRNFNQEIRLTGTYPDAGLVYIVGANYQHDKIFDDTPEQFLLYSGLPPGSSFEARYNLTNRAAAVFGNVDYKITPDLTLTGGVRYTWTKQTVNGCLFGNAGLAGVVGFVASLLKPGVESAYVAGGCQTINNLPPNPDYLPTFSNLQQSQHNVPWRGGVNYKLTDDDLLYGTISRGYKAGTFPLTAILLQSLLRKLSQEQLTSYEVGAKLSFFDKALQVNASGFYYNYKDKQFFTFVPVQPIGQSTSLVNIPHSSVKGLDAEIVARPVEGLTFRTSATYIHTRVGTYNGFDAQGQPESFGDKRFNFAPDWSVTFDADYRFPVLQDVQGYVGLGGVYNSLAYADLGENPDTKIPARMVLDARIGLEADAGWRVGLFVRNLTNKYYWTGVSTSTDTLIRFAGMPRTFGFSAGYRF